MVLSIFGNATDSAVWQPDPNGRGTSGLLQQCLITVGLSIYSAIHLNIPEHKSTGADKALSKICWVLGALLTPEWIVYIAWEQRREAKIIAAILNREAGRAPRPSWITQLLKRLYKRQPEAQDSNMVEEKNCHLAELRDKAPPSSRDPEAQRNEPVVDLEVCCLSRRNVCSHYEILLYVYCSISK